MPISLGEWRTYELMKSADQVYYLLSCGLYKPISKLKLKWYLWRHIEDIELVINILP